MSIVGNMAGCYSPMGKTFVLTDDNGNEITGVVTGQEQKFTATDNDVREGLVYASEDGVSIGTKNIPAYHTTEAAIAIPVGSSCEIPLSNMDKYDYTKLQVIVCSYNTSLSDSVSAEKVVINDCLYNVGETIAISNVSKNIDTKTINLGITNNGQNPLILRYFTYKEID